MSDELANAEVAKHQFVVDPSGNQVMPLIRKAYAAWDAMELDDEEFAEYLELAASWLKERASPKTCIAQRSS